MSDEATQTVVRAKVGLLRLARNDVWRYSRDANCAQVGRLFLPSRGRRECRTSDAPAASRAKQDEHTSSVTTGSPVSNPALPARLVLTVFSALSLVNRACCHHRGPRCLSILGLLDASVGASGPHGFAVRLAPFVTGAKASIASRAQRVVTTAIRPSVRVRDVRIDKAVSTFSRSEIFSQTGLDDPNQLERLCEFAFLVRPRKWSRPRGSRRCSAPPHHEVYFLCLPRPHREERARRASRRMKSRPT